METNNSVVSYNFGNVCTPYWERYIHSVSSLELQTSWYLNGGVTNGNGRQICGSSLLQNGESVFSLQPVHRDSIVTLHGGSAHFHQPVSAEVQSVHIHVTTPCPLHVYQNRSIRLSPGESGLEPDQ